MSTFPDHYLRTQKLLEELSGWYLKQCDAHKDADPVLLVRLMVVALSQYASVLAVDVGMTEDQYLNVCRTQFKEAYRKAPKFG